ncbi:threonine aldolase family protein [Treponema phagedenis]|uniref:threonine aldolase family protein n=1 Tax=Treponema phagedenis TaxID=162 RepID=UPI0001F64102|nr:aminotransferase class V-fold PLP-dependent enzyme [Treponema phagedenis]EFW37850.1 Beta-eliminating lyase [Treponema phagedenis F0421]TYT79694.1 aminotransferase class V-fold PLP-dependent enzyme [Treponema phagedenis]
MIYFNCDYNEGGHPKILERLCETNLEQTAGYGKDDYCEKARKLIQKAMGREDADVHFLVSGTPTNVACLSHMLRRYQAVIAADSSHINVHETGMPESRGHKILEFENRNGKIELAQVEEFMQAREFEGKFEHAVMPKVVFITFPTETGTIYSKKELEELYRYCKAHELYLYIDGARLGYGLTAEGNDLSFQDVANNCDMFCIGGTKCGALLGEAVVILNDELKKDFRYTLKQGGQMLAKGRILGINFEVLFTDGLYFDICKHANEQAIRIRDTLKEKGIEFLVDSPTNQQFPIIPNSFFKATKNEFAFEIIKNVAGDKTAVRICTSWATKDENVDALIKRIEELL